MHPPIEDASPRPPVPFIDQINELRQICVKSNAKKVHKAVLALTSAERQRRMDHGPNSYAALPVCFLGTEIPDDFEIFWAVHGPGPFFGIDGHTTRRSVDLGMVFHTMSHDEDKDKDNRQVVEVLPHGLCFVEQEDAESMAYLLSSARKAIKRKEAEHTRSVLGKKERKHVRRKTPRRPPDADDPGTEPGRADS